jgi:hypothetical protein
MAFNETRVVDRQESRWGDPITVPVLVAGVEAALDTADTAVTVDTLDTMGCRLLAPVSAVAAWKVLEESGGKEDGAEATTVAVEAAVRVIAAEVAAEAAEEAAANADANALLLMGPTGRAKRRMSVRVDVGRVCFSGRQRLIVSPMRAWVHPSCSCCSHMACSSSKHPSLSASVVVSRQASLRTPSGPASAG